MAELKLPNILDHEVIVLHYDPRINPERVILQIPTVDRKSAETYKIKLDRADDFRYITSWTNGKIVLSELKLAGHVMYYPKTGEWLRMEDPEEGFGPRFAKVRKTMEVLAERGAFGSKNIPTLRTS